MRWTPGGRSEDLEDRRDEGGGGGGGGMQFGGRHIGLGGILLLFILSLVFKRDFFSLLGGGGANTGSGQTISRPDPARDAAMRRQVDAEFSGRWQTNTTQDDTHPSPVERIRLALPYLLPAASQLDATAWEAPEVHAEQLPWVIHSWPIMPGLGNRWT